jgi:branched-chain amino acid transport system substrate-binding protein
MAMSGAMAAAAARPAHAADPIRIGYFGPLTGNFSQTGKDMTDGFNLFWEEVGNKVAGREVTVIVEDSDPEPTGALTKVRRLVEQEKVAVAASAIAAPADRALPEQNESGALSGDRARRHHAAQAGRWVVRVGLGSQATHPLGDCAYKQPRCGGWRPSA